MYAGKLIFTQVIDFVPAHIFRRCVARYCLFTKSEVSIMPQTISDTYEHGVFVPRIPVNLPEHTDVKLLPPKVTIKRHQLTDAENNFLALRGISQNLAGMDSVEMQKKILSEWRGQ